MKQNRLIFAAMGIVVVMGGAALIYSGIFTPEGASVETGKTGTATDGKDTSGGNADKPSQRPETPEAPIQNPEETQPPSQEEKHVISGTVTDKKTSDPISGAKIAYSFEMFDAEAEDVAVTNRNGEFRFELPPTEEKRIVVYATHPEFGRWDNMANVLLTPLKTTADVALKRGDTIRCTVVEDTSEAPLPGAAVRLVLGGSIESESSTTVDKRALEGVANKLGVFYFTGVPLGEIVTVSATHDGFVTAGKGVRLVPGAPTANITLRLTRAASLDGQVIDLQRKGLAGASVYCFPRAWKILLNNPDMTWFSDDSETPLKAMKTETDAQGCFSFKGLKPDAVYIVLSYFEKRPRTLVTVKPGAFAEVMMPPGCDLVVRVRGTGEMNIREEIKKYHCAVLDENRQGGVATYDVEKSGEEFDGTARVTELGRGIFLVTFRAEGFPKVEVPDVVLDGIHDREIEIVLDRGQFFAGQVVDGLTGKPIEGAEITIFSGKGEGKARSDEDGKFRVEGLGKEIRQLFVNAKGYAAKIVYNTDGGPHHDPSIRMEGNAAGQVFRLWKHGRLIARIIPPQGEKLPDKVAFYLSHAGGAGGGSTGMPVGQGGLLKRECDPGRLTFAMVVADGFAPCIVRDIEISPAQDKEIDFPLGRGNTLSGTVTDGDTGEPIPGAVVSATELMYVDLSAAADGDGSFTLSKLPRGELSLTISSENHVAKTIVLAFADDGEVRNLDIRLERGGELQGTVTDKNGDPLGNGYVELAKTEDESLYDEAVEEDGSFRIRNIKPGMYRLFYCDRFVRNVVIFKGKAAKVAFRGEE